MKKTFLLALALVALIPMQASKIVTDSVQSSILGKYIKYNIYLPNNFETSSKTYPVVYLLHGLSDNHNAWRDRGNMQTVADELIESGEAREMLIVMPNAGDSHSCCREEVSWSGGQRASCCDGPLDGWRRQHRLLPASS